MTELTLEEGFGIAFEEIVAKQAEAAVAFFRKVDETLQEATSKLASTVASSSRMGRGFLKIEMSTSSFHEDTGFQRIDLKSAIARSVVTVNNYAPGELSVSIEYFDPQKATTLIVWGFPRKKDTLTPKELGEYIVRSLTSPTDSIPQ